MYFQWKYRIICIFTELNVILQKTYYWNDHQLVILLPEILEWLILKKKMEEKKKSLTLQNQMCTSNFQTKLFLSLILFFEVEFPADAQNRICEGLP